MNQFVPQLMLGSALSGSSGPPDFRPQFNHHRSWVFGAQYFFEIWDHATNQSVAKAATGETFPTVAGETLYTRFELGRDWAWTLTMGVK